MKAETLTLNETLGGDVRFLVPVYQRPYVWTQERQWEPLWDDIESTVLRLAEARRIGREKGIEVAQADKSAAPHFLGAIVTQQTDTPLGQAHERLVVDGQQRLTTLQLLLRGVLDALEDARVENQLRARIRKTIRNDEEVVPAEQLLKLRPRLRDVAAFAKAMEAEQVDPADSVFAEVRVFFADAGNSLLRDHAALPSEESSEAAVAARASLLVSALLGLVKLVSIHLEDVDDAQIIFEALNARNTPLSATDLVKNLLFMRAQSQHQDPEEIHNRLWKRFDEDQDWWSEGTGVGHARRARQDWLLGDWLTAQRGQAINVGQLYTEFRNWLEASGVAAVDALSTLNRYADAYEVLEGRREGASGAERRAYEHIEELRITVATPVLLWLLVQESNTLDPSERESAMRAIESFVIRRMAGKYQTRGYGPVFVEVLKAAQAKPTQAGRAVIDALRARPGGYEWPTDDDLRTSFADDIYYGPRGIGQARLRLILREIDSHLQKAAPKTEPMSIDYQKLEIEHVIPQEWRRYWPVGTDDPLLMPTAELERERHVNRIGNLTLVTSPLNKTLSNDPWATKRGQLREHSKLQLNSRLVAHENWDEREIVRRGEWLASVLAEIWPGPESENWSAWSDPGAQV